ncbi:MAG: hypothetical protein QW548_01550, partial [Candidatus Aenigmatarchaeota archaeon]
MPFFRRKPAAQAPEAAAPSRAEIAAAAGRPVEGPPMAAEAAPAMPALPPHPVPGEAAQFAPMFVKVDKYREILTELGELKAFMSSIKQIFSVLSDLETTREDALKTMRAAIQRMERAVGAIDSEMLRPIGFE